MNMGLIVNCWEGMWPTNESGLHKNSFDMGPILVNINLKKWVGPICKDCKKQNWAVQPSIF